MNEEEVEQAIREELLSHMTRETVHGEYHPSALSGCPLKSFLNRMTRTEVTLNSWMFSGSAVHHYLQDAGILEMALHNAGYHTLDTEFEVTTRYQIGGPVNIVGTCDALCHNKETGQRTIFDLKYSSLKPEYNHGRIYTYLSQVNTYAYLMDADEYALIMMHSQSNDLLNNIAVMPGKKSGDNFELVKEKARWIHSAAEDFGYPDGEKWEPSELEDKMDDFWKEVMEYFDRSQTPSYEKECGYCDHEDYCPVVQGGVKQFAKDTNG